MGVGKGAELFFLKVQSKADITPRLNEKDKQKST